MDDIKSRSFFGIILVLLGIGFLLEQFNIISFNNIISLYWPIILIVIGVVGFLNKRSSRVFNMLLVIFGVLFQAQNIDLINVNIYKLFWPIILIIIGISIIFTKNLPIVNKSHGQQSSNGNISLEDYIDEFAIMSGIDTDIGSQEFKGGKITAIMAGIKLDLRGAKLYNNEATININVIMAGIEIYVPENWRIVHSGIPIMGEFDSKRRFNPDPNAPVLTVNFSVLMGGIEIK